jgi:hypothetical protein
VTGRPKALWLKPETPSPGSEVTTAEGPRLRSQGWRILDVTLFVAVWMAVGFLLRLSGAAYLLIGVPFTAAFQLLVRRRPLRELWVRDGPPFRLDAKGVAILAALLLLLGYPAYVRLTSAAGIGAGWLIALWGAAFIAGAVAAAYALRHLRRNARAWGIAGLAALIGLVIEVVGSPLLAGEETRPLSTILGAGLSSAALSFAVAFVVEEVSFRGMFDAHVHHPGEPRGWLTALSVSALWGLWHLPLVSLKPLGLVVASALVIHIAIGIPLSFAWRRSGNLTLPAAAHGFADAVRDALSAA